MSCLKLELVLGLRVEPEGGIKGFPMDRADAEVGDLAVLKSESRPLS